MSKLWLVGRVYTLVVLKLVGAIFVFDLLTLMGELIERIPRFLVLFLVVSFWLPQLFAHLGFWGLLALFIAWHLLSTLHQVASWDRLVHAAKEKDEAA